MQGGWLRANARKLDRRKSTPLEPVLSLRKRDVAPLPRNRFVKVTIPLYYQGHAYRAGSRIRVTITAPNGDQPIWAFAETHAEEDGARSTIASSKKQAVEPDAAGGRRASTSRPSCRRARACAASPAATTSRTRTARWGPAAPASLTGSEPCRAPGPSTASALAYERAGDGPPSCCCTAGPATAPTTARWRRGSSRRRRRGPGPARLRRVRQAPPPAEAYSARGAGPQRARPHRRAGAQRAGPRRLRHRQPHRADRRARRAPTAARARASPRRCPASASASCSADACAILVPALPPARRWPSSSLDGKPDAVRAYLRALLAHWSGPGFSSPRPAWNARRRLRVRRGRSSPRRLVPRGGRDGRPGRSPSTAPGGADRRADDGAVAGARPAVPARVVGPARRLLQPTSTLRRLDGAGHFAPGRGAGAFAAAIRGRRAGEGSVVACGGWS